jgi:hypothetical protein
VADDLFDTKWFRGIVVAALLSGAGNGVVGLSRDVEDRYKGTQAASDFAKRDADIRTIRQALSRHLEHTATYSERIDSDRETLRLLESRVEGHLNAP